MNEYLLILVSTILVNNFVLVKFLGLCPFMGVSKKMDTAIGMGFATTFVLTLASITSYLINTYLLIPFELEYLRTIAFIVTIAAVVGFTELVVNKTSPVLHQSLGVFLPLITTNCAVFWCFFQVSENVLSRPMFQKSFMEYLLHLLLRA